MSWTKFLSKCPYSKKSVPLRKNPGCKLATFSLTFHPNFHTNILVFANLPIYRKLFHDNISLAFWKPRIFYLVLFWRRYTSVLFINISIMIFVSVMLKKIKIIFTPIHLRCCKNSHRIMLGNDTMETASTEVTSVRRRNDIEKPTTKTYRYFVDFESRIHVEISMS